MNVVLKPYPTRKDSGLDWIGEIPAHWDVSRNGQLFSQRIDTGMPELPVLEVSLKTGVKIRDLGRGSRKQAMENRSDYKVARYGDIAYNMMRMWQGAVGVAPVDGLISPAYVVARPRKGVNSRYYSYLFRTGAYKEEVNRRYRGIVSDRNRLYWQDFKQLPSLAPPLAEQVQIVNFLDTHGRAVGYLLHAKQRLIALLNEQKQAIIQQAVTRGLDPNVPLKPSGVDWLGDVPAHWERISLRHLGSKFGSGVTPKGGAAVYVSSGVPLLRSQNVHFDGLRLNGVANIPEHVHQQMSGSHVRPHDVLINITGASIGRVCAVPAKAGSMNVNQHVCIIRPSKVKVVPAYLAYYLSSQSIQDEIRVSQEGASREGLSLKALKALPILVPSLDEQRRIVESIAEQSTDLRDAIRVAEHEIDLIREYRTRLIADVVTGKLDVRGAEVPEVEHEDVVEYLDQTIAGDEFVPEEEDVSLEVGK